MRLPHFSPQRTPRAIITNKHTITKEAPTRCGASFHISDSGRTPSGSPQKMHNPQVNQQSKITPYRRENARTALPPLAEQKRKPSCWRCAARGRREPTQAPQQNHQRPVSAPDPRRNRSATSRNPSCWRSRQTAGVIRIQSAPAEPPTPRHRSRPPRNRSEPPASRPAWRCAARGRREPTQAPQQNRQRPVIAPDPRRNRNATSRNPSCWRCAARGRRDRGQEILIESHIRHRTGAKCGDRAASPRRTAPRPNFELRIPNSELFPPSPPRAPTLLPELKPARDNAAPARNSPTNNDSRRCAASARTRFQAPPAPAVPAFLRRTSALQARADKYPTARPIHAHKKAPSSPTQARRSQLSVIR